MDLLEPWLVDVTLVAALVLGFVGAAALAVVEVSLLRVRPTRVRVAAGQGDRRAIQLVELLDDLPVVLNTVLFTVLLCQVGVAAISGYLAQRWFGGIGVPVASVVVTLLLFVYAESLPKTLAVSAPYERALRAATSLRWLTRLWRPVVKGLVSMTDLHTRRVDIGPEVVSERELRLLARQAAQAGEIAVDDADLVDRSFRFGDQRVADVMVGRDQIVGLRSDLTVDAALNIALRAGHRRMPVYERDLDDMVGVIRLRDLAAARSETEHRFTGRMHSPLFCSPCDTIAHLIERMRASGRWLAIVREHDSVTVGLLTVEDIVAELMGEIEESPVLRGPNGS